MDILVCGYSLSWLLPDTMCVPSDDRATDMTVPQWPMRVRTPPPVARSQTLTVRSLLPETMCAPSDDSTTEMTLSEWPRRVLVGCSMLSGYERR